jgi:hypothetical protein
MLAGHLARLIDDHTGLNHAQRLRTLADMAVAEQLEEGPLRRAKGRGPSPPLEPTTPHGANRLPDRPPGDSQFSSASSNRDRKSDTPSGLRRSSPQSANRCPPAITRRRRLLVDKVAKSFWPTATSCQVRHSHRRPGVVGRQQSRIVAGLRGGHRVSRVQSQDCSFPHSPPRRPLERWTRLQLPDGPMAQDFEPVRRSRASMTVGQTSIS